MKTRRFFSAFLLAVLLLTTVLSPAALAAEDEPVLPEDPNIQAKAALLIERNSGAILYDKNKDETLYPASLTKIMTALVVLEAVDAGTVRLDQTVTATESAFATLSSDGSSANIKIGETMTVEELLYCMLVVSANEACNILAEAVSGSVDAFVAQMNAKAEALECEHTHFVNATGLHDEDHYTTAWDLYLITTEALTHELFLTICDTPDIVLPATNVSGERHLYTTNSLLSNWRAIGYRYSKAHGIKTGSTSEAGQCLISSASDGTLELLSVVLGAETVTLENGKRQQQSFSETSRLFDWGFENFSFKTILTAEEMLGSMPVTLSQEASSVALHAAQSVSVLMPNGLSAEDLTRTIRFQSASVEAPVSLGDQLAEVELSYDGTVYATVPLVSVASVEASRSLVLLAAARAFFDRSIVRVVLAVVVLALLALLVWKLTVGRRRYRSGRKVSRRDTYRGRRR